MVIKFKGVFYGKIFRKLHGSFFVKINPSLFLKAFRRFRGKKYFYIFVDCAVKNSNLVFEI